jgi:hypothetical protein
MTANSTEAETDRAIPLDKLSSRMGDQTGRAGYVVFVLNIGRVLNISHILNRLLPCRSCRRLRSFAFDLLKSKDRSLRQLLQGGGISYDAVYDPTQNGSHR